MAKYRKKPVVVEAFQLTALYDEGARNFLVWCIKVGLDNCAVAIDREHQTLIIQTLDADRKVHRITVRRGDWIMKGETGKFYSSESDIFEQTYEPVEASP